MQKNKYKVFCEVYKFWTIVTLPMRMNGITFLTSLTSLVTRTLLALPKPFCIINQIPAKTLGYTLRENSLKYCTPDGVGGTVASCLKCSTPDGVVQVWVLVRDIVLCSWARLLTLTVPLSTQVYKWVPAKMLGVTLRWISIQGGVEILLKVASCYGTRDKRGLMGLSGS